jgi:hypothetical protein
MVEPPDGPGAVFVVRVWFESAAGDGFRARVTQAVDPRGPGRSVVLTEPAHVVAAMEQWLLEFYAEHGVEPM